MFALLLQAAAADSDSQSDSDVGSDSEELVNVKQTKEFDPAEPGAKKQEEADVGRTGMIHLYFQKRNARKCLTLVQGLPEDLDLEKIARTFRKMWHCNGTKHHSEKWGEIIQLQGDHRNQVKQFLIEEGIGTKDNIQKHGY